MPADLRIESLQRDHHDRNRFDCGEPALNRFLTNFAGQNQELGVARTFVAVGNPDSAQVLGYYSLAVGSIDKANLPLMAVRRFPNFPMPIARLARLAVDRSQQGQRLGEHLLVDAMGRCVRVAEDVGIAALFVDAKHEKARSFYLRYEFEPLPDQPLTLFLLLSTLRRLLGFKAT